MASMPPDAQLCPTCFCSLRSRGPDEWHFIRSSQRHRRMHKRKKDKSTETFHFEWLKRTEVFWSFPALHLAPAAYKEYPLHESEYVPSVIVFVFKQVNLLYLKIHFLVHLLDMHLGCWDKKSSREYFGVQVLLYTKYISLGFDINERH